MKKFAWTFLALGFILCSFVVFPGGPSAADSVSSLSEQATEALATQNVLWWAPPKSTIVKQGANKIKITPPAGQFQYIGRTLKGSILQGGLSATISCNCTQGSGCAPAAGHGSKGCVISDGCTSCTGTVSVLDPTSNIPEVMASGGFASNNANLRLAKPADVANRPTVFAEMFMGLCNNENISAFRTNQLKANANGPKARTYVVIHGRIGIMEGSVSAIKALGGIVLSAKGSCSCSDGTCTYKKSMGVEYCDSNCSGTCSLTTGFKDNLGGAVETVSPQY